MCRGLRCLAVRPYSGSAAPRTLRSRRAEQIISWAPVQKGGQMKKTLELCRSAMTAVPSSVLPAVLAMALVAAGCTAIGFGIGAAIDNSHKTPDTVESWQILRIEKRTPGTVSLPDRSE